MTRRLIRAIEHPLTTMLGHVTGRLLLRREGYKLDFGKVIDAAIAHGVIIELKRESLAPRPGLASLAPGGGARFGVLHQP
jgi:histidinol phosphatase-like PHP family hydrolase